MAPEKLYLHPLYTFGKLYQLPFFFDRKRHGPHGTGSPEYFIAKRGLFLGAAG